MSVTFKDFSYGTSSDISDNLRVQICCLAGMVKDLKDSLFITAKVWSNDRALCPIIRTRPSCSSADLDHEWNEWITFPLKYNELPLATQITFTIWNIADGDGLLNYAAYSRPLGKPFAIGGSTFRLYDSKGYLKKSRQKLLVHVDTEADGGMHSRTLSDNGPSDEIDMYETLLKRHESGDIAHVEWLDKLILKEIHEKRKELLGKSKSLFLYIQMPNFSVPVIYNEMIYPSVINKARIGRIYDPEMFQQDNPIELKHRKLVRGHRAGPFDRELKPNPKTRDDLQRICNYPPTRQLTTEESDLVWKFRFNQTRNKHALTKFLKCVDWKDENETQQALELLPLWSEIDADDALELLGPSFDNSNVRHHAIKTLEKANDEDLQLYLLQLVEAIKFENIGDKGAYESPLVEFLVKRAMDNRLLGNDLHWYLMCECDDKTHSKLFGKVSYHFMSRMVEYQDGYLRRDMLKRQADLVDRLCVIMKDLRQTKDSRFKKIERLQLHLSDPNNGLVNFTPMPLPLDASVEICGIQPEKATIFKSNLMPLKLVFSTTRGQDYAVIFKLGDDLRQDQLVMQVIKLMNKLLLKENLDLKLTPYRVLATGTDHGMLEFVDSVPIANIMSTYGDILSYLRENNPSPLSNETFGISLVAMDNYLKSCAGYCVITYLLGIGDRHLDNLLLTPSGNLFHIDFGYMLGRDPKPFPPPMKLGKEMVDAMGGVSSVHFQKFKSLCYSAFMILRKSSNLILNLFALMVDANIPDIKIEPDKAVLKVQEKFRLDLSDEEAIQYFQSLINDSVTAMFPQLMETMHKLAQYMKS